MGRTGCLTAWRSVLQSLSAKLEANEAMVAKTLCGHTKIPVGKKKYIGLGDREQAILFCGLCKPLWVDQWLFNIMPL